MNTVKMLVLMVAAASTVLLCPPSVKSQGALGGGQNHNNGPLEGDVDFGGMGSPSKPPSPIDAPGSIPHAGGTKPAATSLTPGVRSGIFPTSPPAQIGGGGTGSSAIKPPSSSSPRTSSPGTSSNSGGSDSKQFQFKVTAKESGPFSITAVVKAKDTRAPLEQSHEENGPASEDTGSSEDEEKQKLIKAYQSEIEKRKHTNTVLQQHVDELAGYMLKDMLKNSVIDATGTVNETLFNSQPKPIRDAMKEFEKGHWARDLEHATTAFANAAQSLTSGGDDMFYVNQGKIEIERNNLFIQMLQEKIDALHE